MDTIKARLVFEKRIVKEKLASLFPQSSKEKPQTTIEERQENASSFFHNIRDLVNLENRRRGAVARSAASEERIRDASTTPSYRNASYPPVSQPKKKKIILNKYGEIVEK